MVPGEASIPDPGPGASSRDSLCKMVIAGSRFIFSANAPHQTNPMTDQPKAKPQLGEVISIGLERHPTQEERDRIPKPVYSGAVEAHGEFLRVRTLLIQAWVREGERSWAEMSLHLSCPEDTVRAIHEAESEPSGEV